MKKPAARIRIEARLFDRMEKIRNGMDKPEDRTEFIEQAVYERVLKLEEASRAGR